MTLSQPEQEHRTKAMEDALANVRLAGLEPDPIIFTSIERYVRGDMTLTEAIADYSARLVVQGGSGAGRAIAR